MSDTINFEWIMFASEAEHELKSLVESGASIEKHEPYTPTEPDEIEEFAHAAFDPLMILTGSVAAAFIIERVVFSAKSLKGGGAVVDTRGDKVRITPTRDFEPGTIVLVKPKGEVEVLRPEAKPLDIISSIKALLGVPLQ
jgi:hypothetical protein